MRIGVLILNHDGREWLAPLYESLRRQEVEDVRVYLVDNASTDDSVALTRRDYPEVTVLRMPANLGYSMAYNAAMPPAFADGCDWVVWANNDILLEPGCLAELARIASGPDGPDIVGPAFLAWEGEGPNAYMTGAHPEAVAAMRAGRPDPVAVDWVEGSFLMVSRACVQQVGWLDPYLFFYWEEADFCRRARRLGRRIALAPAALARHYAGGTARRRAGPLDRLKTRNHYIYTLANPCQGWARNCLDAVRLLAVRLKAGLLRGEGDPAVELSVFAGLLGQLRQARNKWRRDRSGAGPPAFAPGVAPFEPEVIGP